ncbi:MAG: non-hydrolyzing UDP-N-acetylglucosamine 2-epimerase [Candidatus Binatia bacterium]
MKVVSVVGARPQFIKAAPVSRELRARGHTDLLLHTGQHYDHGMSQVFFDDLEIRPPHVNLGVGSGPHGRQTADMLAGIEEVLIAERPDWVLVYGDTNSTLAGALAACKAELPLGHVEAGLRSFNRGMPEEHNRVLTDHCSDLLFCPTETAVANLAREGIHEGVRLVGDTMYDAVLDLLPLAEKRSNVLRDLGLAAGGYLVATVHRAYNTDVAENLRSILAGLAALDEPVVLPLHPRTRRRIADWEKEGQRFPLASSNMRVIDPVGYLDMLVLQSRARKVLTDSGGMQKEAYFLGVPCVTLRPETEWVETVEDGWNIVAGTDPEAIVRAVRAEAPRSTRRPERFGSGKAAQNVVRSLGE